MSIFSCLRSLPLLHKQNPTAAANGSVDLLLLGSGWTSTFLLPLAADAGLSTASTTRSGGNGTIQWQFDPSSDDTESFKVLPDAQTVLIVFPIYEEGGVDRLVKGYLESRSSSMQYYFDDEKASTRGIDNVNTRFVLLGSTGIYDNGPTLGLGTTLDKHHLGEEKKKKKHPGRKSPWVDNRSSFEPLPRAVSEQRLLELSKHDNRIRAKPIPTAVLLLCGLWGHGRSVRNFISRLPGDKDVFRNLGSVHLVHGRDVGRAVLALHGDFDAAEGKRWILTNGRVYDIWDLASRFGSAGEDGRNHPPTGPYPAIVQELLNEKGSNARALPRSAEEMFEANGSLALDGREFWSTFGLTPDSPWVD